MAFISSLISADSKFTNLNFSVDGIDRTAAVYLPENYNANKKWPLLIYLHGGGNGGDNQGNAIDWAKKQPISSIITQKPLPAIVLIPRCPKGKIWAPVPKGTYQSAWRMSKFKDEIQPDASNHITKAIDSLFQTYSVDESKISLTGFSMGGEGTIRYGALHHQRFSALAPMAGSAIAIKTDAPKLAQLKIWMFQGAKDKLSTSKLGQKMSTWVKEAGGDIKYTEFENIAHNIPKKALAYEGMLNWLITQQK